MRGSSWLGARSFVTNSIMASKADRRNRWHLHCETEMTDLKSCVDVYGPRPIATTGLIRIDGHNC